MAAALAALLLPTGAWFGIVNNEVKQPYLDEFFHVAQAQCYCDGRFDIWDPAITTPPGLYFVSYLLSPLLGCSLTSLRLINILGLAALVLVVRATYSLRRSQNNENGFLSGLLATHSSLNVALFPLLFFWSAMYYTDIMSTLSVMVFYWYFLRTLSVPQPAVYQDAILVVLGLSSLTFRQTNIFWIAVAPAALVVFDRLDIGHPVVRDSMHRKTGGFGDTMTSVVRSSWKMDVVYDPPSEGASWEDYTRCVLSIFTCVLKTMTQPRRASVLFRGLAPYVTLICLFAAFVAWNGSVVLGHKDHHSATINLPQMLYLWPYIAFFSWPLLLPQFILLPLTLLSRLSHFSSFEPLLSFRRRNHLPRLASLAAALAVALLTVHYNTVVHRFITDNNRNYYFYIFRRLLSPWWMRYAVTPIYILTAWACLSSRSTPGDSSPTPKSHQEVSPPRATTRHLPDGKTPPRVSFYLVLIATSALQLCPAGLVEPRYCILPWLMWRLHLPLFAIDTPRASARSWTSILQEYDWRVVLETMWFLVVNGVTGWIFVNWTFVEKGTEELQRISW